MSLKRYPIRDWPEGERPRERLLAEGPRRLTTAELLGIVLRTGAQGRSAVDLARTLLQEWKSLAGLEAAEPQILAETKGMGPAKIAQVKAALELGRRFYVPLPKLTSRQVGVVAGRLQALGFQTARSEVLHARKGRDSVTLESRGVCSSNRDLVDILAPVIPDLISKDRERVPFNLLCDRYFQVTKTGPRATLKLRPRLESATLWDELRESDSSGLTPDERAVYELLLSRAGISCRVLTDYPTDGCSITRIGRKRYYYCEVAGSDAAINLREIGARRPRNSYLPRSSIIRIDSFTHHDTKLRQVLAGLGDWCFLTICPTSRKL